MSYFAEILGRMLIGAALWEWYNIRRRRNTAARAKEPRAPKWESIQYKTMAFDTGLPSAEQMDELGTKGWRLSTIVPYAQGSAMYFCRVINT